MSLITSGESYHFSRRLPLLPFAETKPSPVSLKDVDPLNLLFLIPLALISVVAGVHAEEFREEDDSE